MAHYRRNTFIYHIVEVVCGNWVFFTQLGSMLVHQVNVHPNIWISIFHESIPMVKVHTSTSRYRILCISVNLRVYKTSEILSKIFSAKLLSSKFDFCFFLIICCTYNCFANGNFSNIQEWHLFKEYYFLKRRFKSLIYINTMKMYQLHV